MSKFPTDENTKSMHGSEDFQEPNKEVALMQFSGISLTNTAHLIFKCLCETPGKKSMLI